MARKQIIYTDEQKFVALAFLTRLQYDFALAAKKAKVPEAALRVWYGEDLIAQREKEERGETDKPAPQELVRLKLLTEPPSVTAPQCDVPVVTPAFVAPENRLTRPYPPEHLSRPERWPTRVEPAPDVADWIKAALIEPSGPLFELNDWHLGLANIGVLWCNVPSSRGGRPTWGEIEIPLMRTKSKWERAKQEQQLIEWFGGVPDFVITIDSVFGAESDDRTWCSGCKHELKHIWYMTDKFGQMKWKTDEATGAQYPMWKTRGHDVEEFIEIAEHYGVEACAGRSMAFLAALQQTPIWTDDDIELACGRD